MDEQKHVCSDRIGRGWMASTSLHHIAHSPFFHLFFSRSNDYYYYYYWVFLLRWHDKQRLSLSECNKTKYENGNGQNPTQATVCGRFQFPCRQQVALSNFYWCVQRALNELETTCLAFSAFIPLKTIKCENGWKHSGEEGHRDKAQKKNKNKVKRETEWFWILITRNQIVSEPSVNLFRCIAIEANTWRPSILNM